jgi:hypothetical protein
MIPENIKRLSKYNLEYIKPIEVRDLSNLSLEHI